MLYISMLPGTGTCTLLTVPGTVPGASLQRALYFEDNCTRGMHTVQGTRSTIVLQYKYQYNCSTTCYYYY